jgi:hypothetical protein
MKQVLMASRSDGHCSSPVRSEGCPPGGEGERRRVTRGGFLMHHYAEHAEAFGDERSSVKTRHSLLGMIAAMAVIDAIALFLALTVWS